MKCEWVLERDPEENRPWNEVGIDYWTSMSDEQKWKKERLCVFLGVGKKSGVCKVGLGLEDLAKKVWWVYGVVKMAIYKEWRSKEEANCGKKRLRTIPGFKRTGKRENIRVWFLIWWYKYFAVQFRISQFYFFNCVCEFLFITNKKFKF